MTEATRTLMRGLDMMIVRRQPIGPPTIERVTSICYHDRETDEPLGPVHSDSELVTVPTRAELERLFSERPENAEYAALSVTALWFADLLSAWWHSYQGQEETWTDSVCPFCGCAGPDVRDLDWHGDGCLYGFVGRWIKEG